MSSLLEINKRRLKKFNWFLVLCVGVILWICQPSMSAGPKCGRPGRTQSSKYEPVGEDFFVHDVVRYSCNETYVILGVEQRHCLSNGMWSSEMPVCCKLAEIDNIKALSEADDQLPYLIDGNISTCSESINHLKTPWIVHLASLTNVAAVRITVLATGEVDFDVTIQTGGSDDGKCSTKNAGSEFVVKSTKTLTYHCPDDTAGNSIYIKSNYSNLRLCEISALLPPDSTCFSPDIPLHGHKNRVVANPEKYLFTCHEGYKAWGTLIVTCQSDGTWSPRSPICSEIYCFSDESSNGFIEYNGSTSRGRVPYKGTIRFYCNEGHHLVGQHTANFSYHSCQKWNEWNPPLPECKLKPSVTSTYSTAAMSNSTSSVTNSTSSISISTSLTSTSTYSTSISTLAAPSVIAALTESWVELNVKSCGVLNLETDNNGEWLSVNGSGSLLVLTCPEDFHIEGSPAFTRCLSNGTWSYTSAVCKKSSEGLWGSTWSPSFMLMIAIAAGAGTAILILCFFVGFLIIRKRRQTQANTTVFHLDNEYHEIKLSKKDIHQHKHLLKSESYESIVERRLKSTNTTPRKPRSALPNIPLDADPVYAQPFETTPIKKVSTATVNGKDDLYNAHIYAEPIDSRTPNNTATNAPTSRIRKELCDPIVKVKSKSEQPQPTPAQTQNCHKSSICAIYDTANRKSHNSGRLRTENKFYESNEKTENAAIKKNIEYIELI